MLRSIAKDQSFVGKLRFAYRQKNLMDAKEFCDRWFGYEGLSMEELENIWTTRGHRANCVRLLADILGQDESYIRKRWGARFEDMPSAYGATLKYADALRQVVVVAVGVLTPDRVLEIVKKSLE